MVITDEEKLLYNLVPFREVPVSIDQFLDDTYYLKDHFPVTIYPFWRKELRKIFPNNIITPYKYLIFSGAIGAGKSSISEVVLLYDLYKLSCLKSVPDFMGISSQNGYCCMLYNIHKYSMERFYNTINNTIFDKVVGSPYFIRQKELGNKFLNTLHIEIGARPKDMLSRDVVGFWLSELNMYPHQAQANDVINSANSRLFGRFLRGERLFHHIILDSSTVDNDTAVEQFIANNTESDKTYIIRPSVWEPVMHQNKYFQLDPPSFDVYIGDDIIPPHIIRTDEDKKRLDFARIIKAPSELYHEAHRDINLFLQEKCGIALHATDAFFQNLERIEENAKFKYELNDVIILDSYDKEDKLINYVKPLISLLPKDRQIFIAIDNAYSEDLLGLSIGYVDSIIRSETRDTENLNRAHISIPISLGIYHKEGQFTPINKVVEFIVKLSSSYDIGHVWFDSFQSESIRQPLLQNEIEADISSVDINEEPYATARRLIYEGLVSYSDHPILMQGFKTVRRMVSPNGIAKVVHNRLSSQRWDGKDLLDPVVNLIFNMSTKIDPAEAVGKTLKGRTEDYRKEYVNYLNNVNSSDYVAW